MEPIHLNVGGKSITTTKRSGKVDAEEPGFLLRKVASSFSDKLYSFATYATGEIKDLDCERTTLYPGDVLFLPRRVVHFARSLTPYSAHLTFGFNEKEMCMAHDDFNQRQRVLGWFSCDSICNSSCDFAGIDSCDTSLVTMLAAAHVMYNPLGFCVRLSSSID